MEEEVEVKSDQIKQTLNDLSIKIDALSKSIENVLEEKKECVKAKISENPLAYVAGAFVGGMIVGSLMGRGKS